MEAKTFKRRHGATLVALAHSMAVALNGQTPAEVEALCRVLAEAEGILKDKLKNWGEKNER